MKRAFTLVEVLKIFLTLLVALFIIAVLTVVSISIVVAINEQPVAENKITVPQADFEISEWQPISRTIHYSIVKIEGKRYLLFNKGRSNLEVVVLDDVQAEQGLIKTK